MNIILRHEDKEHGWEKREKRGESCEWADGQEGAFVTLEGTDSNMLQTKGEIPRRGRWVAYLGNP